MPAMATVDGLEADHRNFARLLDRMAGDLDRIRAGSSADFELLRDMIHYMTRFPDLVHHPTEDELLARLGRARPELSPLGEDLAAEHRKLAETSLAFLASVEQVVDGGLTLREELLAAGESYVDQQRRHMRWEEETLFPRVRGTLTAREARAVSAELEARGDPLFGPVLAEEYRALWEHIARQPDDSA
jgi:hemerythrin-like domain-containing protein